MRLLIILENSGIRGEKSWGLQSTCHLYSLGLYSFTGGCNVLSLVLNGQGHIWKLWHLSGKERGEPLLNFLQRSQCRSQEIDSLRNNSTRTTQPTAGERELSGKWCPGTGAASSPPCEWTPGSARDPAPPSNAPDPSEDNLVPWIKIAENNFLKKWII